MNLGMSISEIGDGVTFIKLRRFHRFVPVVTTNYVSGKLEPLFTLLHIAMNGCTKC